MKKWIRILNFIMITSVSVTLIRLIVDYVYLIILHPEVYMVMSAPWYTGGLVYGVITLPILLVCVMIKAIIKYRKKTD